MLFQQLVHILPVAQQVNCIFKLKLLDFLYNRVLFRAFPRPVQRCFRYQAIQLADYSRKKGFFCS